MVISASLEAQNALSGYDCSDYFWSGIQPTSLRDVLEIELRNQNFWINLTLPLPMNRIIEVANKFLNQDIYQPRDVNLRGHLAKTRKWNRCLADSDDKGSVEDSSSESSSLPSEDESGSSDEEEVIKPKSKGKRCDSPIKDESVLKESKAEEKAVKLDANVQSNIEDLAERFKRLELKLGERARNHEGLPPKMHSVMYCIMCGKQGHGICDCSESKFFIAQGICHMDVNNCVVMGDGTALPRAKGEGSAAKVIHDRMAGIPSLSRPTTTSASNEVITNEVDYEDETDELAILGSMEFKVLPADRTEKSKKYKPYDRTDAKKGVEKTVPEVISCPHNPPLNRAYVELPPTILKCVPPAQVAPPPGEDKEMVDAPVPVPSKGESREHPVMVPTLLREPEVMSQKP